MNNGTIIRTVLVIATCFNTALMATDVAQFHNETVNLIYRIISVILNFIVVACVTWYNNDYTPEACEGTGYTRMLKSGDDGIGIEVEDYLEDGDEDE
jgi:SPP1 family holin